jgi:hypothetical protein
MDFGLVAQWISKVVKDLALVFKCNNESKIERFWFISNVVYYLWTLSSEKNLDIFPKSISSWKKHELNWNFAYMF